MTTEAAKRPEQLQQEAADVLGRIRALEEQRANLLRDAILAGRAGHSPNGSRSKLLEADAELDILKGTLAQIEEELPEAERQSAAETVAGILDAADAIREEGRIVASSASDALRELVSEARKLGALAVKYRGKVEGAKNVARNAGVSEPAVNDDLLAGVFPSTPDRWGIGYYWTSKVEAVLSELEQVVTALDGAERWSNRNNRSD